MTTGYDYGSGYPVGELWIVDPVSGADSLLATSGARPVNGSKAFRAVGYPGSARIYVAEDNEIWVIQRDIVPARAETWGALKARYRGERVAR